MDKGHQKKGGRETRREGGKDSEHKIPKILKKSFLEL